MENCKYDVFISYSRRDYFDENNSIITGNIVSRIMDALTSSNISFWFDKDYVYHGDDFAEKILTNIEDASTFVFISSINSNNSKWTRKEISCADNKGKKIIPFRVDNSSYDKAVELRLVDLDYVDATKNPDIAIAELIHSIEAELKSKREAKRKKEEQEKQLISEIEIKIEQISNNIQSYKTEQKKLSQRIKTINNTTEKKRLSSALDMVFSQITNTPSQNKDNIINELKIQLSDSTESINSLSKENKTLKGSCTKLKNTNNRLKENNTNLQSQIEDLKKQSSDFSPLLYTFLSCILALSSTLLFVISIFDKVLYDLPILHNIIDPLLDIKLAIIILSCGLIISCILSMCKSIMSFVMLTLTSIAFFVVILCTNPILWWKALLSIVTLWIIYSWIHTIQHKNNSAFDVLS